VWKLKDERIGEAFKEGVEADLLSQRQMAKLIQFAKACSDGWSERKKAISGIVRPGHGILR